MIIYYFALKQKSHHKILLFHPSYNESIKIILLRITNKKQLKKEDLLYILSNAKMTNIENWG